MTQNKYVASKRDIIIFFIISIFYSIISSIIAVKPHSLYEYIEWILFLTIYYPPAIIAIIINLIIKYVDIKNEKALKVIKILFNIFAFIYVVLMSFLVYLGCAIAQAFKDDIGLL